MRRMNVKVNGETREVAPHTTLATLVRDMECCTVGVAIAVNAEVVPGTYWSTTELREHDQVEVLTVMQGG